MIETTTPSPVKPCRQAHCTPMSSATPPREREPSCAQATVRDANSSTSWNVASAQPRRLSTKRRRGEAERVWNSIWSDSGRVQRINKRRPMIDETRDCSATATVLRVEQMIVSWGMHYSINFEERHLFTSRNNKENQWNVVSWKYGYHPIQILTNRQKQHIQEIAVNEMLTLWIYQSINMNTLVQYSGEKKTRKSDVAQLSP